MSGAGPLIGICAKASPSLPLHDQSLRCIVIRVWEAVVVVVERSALKAKAFESAGYELFHRQPGAEIVRRYARSATRTHLPLTER